MNSGEGADTIKLGPDKNAGGGPSRPAPQGGRPLRGKELGRGAEGIVYEIVNDPNNVIKEYHVSNLPRARNEFTNLANARAIRPDNAVTAQPPMDPQQDWLVKERVYPSNTHPDFGQRARVLHDFQNIPDAASNLIWGATKANPAPSWILNE